MKQIYTSGLEPSRTVSNQRIAMGRRLLMMLLFFAFVGGVKAQQDLPYSYGFEDNDLAADGWTANITSDEYGISNYAAYNGSSYGFMFYYTENPGYLISPLLTGGENGIDVSFWYAEYTDQYGDEQFQVGYTTDESVTDPDGFTYGDVITASTSWQQYENTFPAGTKRIAIKYVYNDAYYLFLDDITGYGEPEATTLNLTFGETASTLEAGTPYIIRWTDGENIVDPVFEGVTLDATEHNFVSGSGETRVSFLGNYDAMSFTDNDKESVLLMGGNNELYFANANAGLGACRAYFEIGENGNAARLNAFNMRFGDETTGIRTIGNEPLTMHGNDAWYSLDGRKLNGKPAMKGVYINKGNRINIK